MYEVWENILGGRREYYGLYNTKEDAVQKFKIILENKYSKFLKLTKEEQRLILNLGWYYDNSNGDDVYIKRVDDIREGALIYGNKRSNY